MLKIEEIEEVKSHIDDALAFMDRLDSHIYGYGSNCFFVHARAALQMAKIKLQECEINIQKRL